MEMIIECEQGIYFSKANEEQIALLQEIIDAQVQISINAEYEMSKLTHKEYEHSITKVDEKQEKKMNVLNSQSASLNSTLALFPNPAENKVTFIHELNENSKVNIIEIFDLLGHLKASIKIDANSRNTIYDSSILISGVYTCIMKSDGKVIDCTKLVILKWFSSPHFNLLTFLYIMEKLIIFILLSAFTAVNSQNVFNNKFFTSTVALENEFSRANNVLQSSDGSFIVVGTGANTSKMSAIKLDKNGFKLWKYSEDFNDYNIHYFNDIIESNDNNFIIGATVADSIVGFSNAGILKLDKNTGDTIWLKTYGINTSSEYCYSIKKTTNNGFVFSGVRYSTDSLNVTQSDVYLVKTDSLGNLEWEKTFGGVKYEWGQSIELTDDGGYIILGITTTFGAGGVDMYCIKTDSVGNLLWEKTFGSYWDDYGLSICKLQDGNFALVGNTHLNSTKIAANIIKINPEGEIIWQKKFIGNYDAQEFTGVKQSTTGEIVLCGNSQSDTVKSSFYGLVKLLNDNDGSVIWERQYSYIDKDSTDHYFYGMDLCNDGGFVFAGMTRNWNPGEGPGNSMWVVKTDCMGNDSIWDNAACPLKADTPDTVINFNLYPNPSTGAVTLDYFIPQNAQNQSITFYDATGKLVQKVDFTGEGQIQLNIDCSEFSNGVYQCVLVSDGEVVEQGKLVIIQ